MPFLGCVSPKLISQASDSSQCSDSHSSSFLSWMFDLITDPRSCIALLWLNFSLFLTMLVLRCGLEEICRTQAWSCTLNKLNTHAPNLCCSQGARVACPAAVPHSGKVSKNDLDLSHSEVYCSGLGGWLLKLYTNSPVIRAAPDEYFPAREQAGRLPLSSFLSWGLLQRP